MSALETVKEIAQLVQKIDNIELYRQILDLQGEILEALEENSKLREQIRNLQESLKIKDSLVFKDNAYWISNGSEDMDGPFCTHCKDRDDKLVRLHLQRPKQWSCQTHGWLSHEVGVISYVR